MLDSWWTTDSLSAQHVENGVCSTTERFLCIHCQGVFRRVRKADAGRLEYRAARLEAQQALRDWNEQIRSLGAHFTAEGDFLMWRLGGYSQAAERAAFALLPY